MNKKTEAEQLDDHIARFFMEPAYEVLVSLIEGKNTNDAYTKSQNVYRKKLTELVTSSNKEYNTVLASHLYHNFQCQVCLGDQNAFF